MPWQQRHKLSFFGCVQTHHHHHHAPPVGVVSCLNFNMHVLDYVLSILTMMYHTCLIDFRGLLVLYMVIKKTL